jgi:hypothetical protein
MSLRVVKKSKSGAGGKYSYIYSSFQFLRFVQMTAEMYAMAQFVCFRSMVTVAKIVDWLGVAR